MAQPVRRESPPRIRDIGGQLVEDAEAKVVATDNATVAVREHERVVGAREYVRLDAGKAETRRQESSTTRSRETEDRLGQGVVVGVADAAHRGLDPSFGQALRVADRDVLHAAVAVMDESLQPRPCMRSPLERIERQIAPE